ncbi:phosphatase PAP2 family protein [Jeotgalibacillus proteolyticus]|uniref:Phosphoesterase PA-phosphatase n=1 Tax=Jeotgalibacillus proteolyticus TaxID=2082395 RepID=A0A2S5G9A8_9BACL|nr:phosphatase PAP2 family protein [Jeotgalibacillus proteolyticus]PPA69559.1 phosphoesterase PA-phosphatase [Jeotgalibacillus proteolyticus]
MHSKNNIHIFFPVTCLILFILISVLSWREQLELIDSLIIDGLARWISPAIVMLMEGITKIGSGETILILTFLLSLYLLFKKLWKEIIFLYVLTLGGILLNFLLKVGFQRQRPGEMSSIEVFGNSLEITSYSFPSGHTMRSVLLFSFLIYLSLVYLNKLTIKTAIIFSLITMIFLVAISRIIIGAHFPSDIFAAITISITWFYLCLSGIRLTLLKELRFL